MNLASTLSIYIKDHDIILVLKYIILNGKKQDIEIFWGKNNSFKHSFHIRMVGCIYQKKDFMKK